MSGSLERPETDGVRLGADKWRESLPDAAAWRKLLASSVVDRDWYNPNKFPSTLNSREKERELHPSTFSPT